MPINFITLLGIFSWHNARFNMITFSSNIFFYLGVRNLLNNLFERELDCLFKFLLYKLKFLIYLYKGNNFDSILLSYLSA